MKQLRMVAVWYLVGAMFVMATAPRCFAGFSSSKVMVLSPSDHAADLSKLQQFLEIKMVRERLKDLGFAPEEVRAKLQDFDSRQVHQLAIHLDEMKAAGDGGAVVVIVFLAAVLVALIIYATGHRIVLR